MKRLVVDTYGDKCMNENVTLILWLYGNYCLHEELLRNYFVERLNNAAPFYDNTKIRPSMGGICKDAMEAM